MVVANTARVYIWWQAFRGHAKSPRSGSAKMKKQPCVAAWLLSMPGFLSDHAGVGYRITVGRVEVVAFMLATQCLPDPR